MSFISNISEKLYSSNIPIYTSRWELLAADSQRDLVIKKIAFTIIALLNLAAVGIALYYIITFCPVPAQAALISPFIVGVLGALAYLKFPTFGITYFSPANMIGKVVAYLFFGPMMWGIDRVDWTAYHDPICANRISKDLEEISFEHIAQKYGSHFDNLVKYGFIHQNYQKDLKNLYHDYKPISKELAFWKQEGLVDCTEAQNAKKRLEEVEKKWSELKKKLVFHFPHPEIPSYDFSKRMTTLRLKVRAQNFFNTSLNTSPGFKT